MADPKPQLRPGTEPVDMSPEAVAERRRDVLKRLATSNVAAQRKAAAQRGELPFGEEEDQ